VGARGRRHHVDQDLQLLHEGQPAGGSHQLGELIDEHGAALAYDLAGLGIDIRDLWRPGSRLSPRYVLLLVGQPDDTSAFSASVRGGPEFRPWSLANVLLAAQVNLLHNANGQRAGKRVKPLIEPPKKKAKPRVVRIGDLLRRRKSE
jgi:hypothetical protein